VAHRSYRIGGFRFGIRTTSERFGLWLDDALGAYRIGRRQAPAYSIVVGDDGEEAREAAAVRPRRKLHILYLGTQQAMRTRSLSTLGRAVLAEMDTLTSAKRKDAVFLNAALVVSDGTTALMPSQAARFLGRSHRRAERMGVALPAVHSVAVDMASGRAVPAQPHIELPADVLDRLADLAGPEGDEDRFVLDSPRRVDAVLTYAPQEGPPLQPISRAQALHRAAGMAMNLPKVKGKGVEGLARLMEGARCYELGAWDSTGMLRAVAEALEPGRAKGRTRPAVGKIRRQVDERDTRSAYTPEPARG
jgi:hypothetical protein